jgi:hypothetical protein
MTHPSESLWVGVFVKTGALVVYDSALQIAGQPEVNLYSVNKGGVRSFEPDFARSKVSSAKGAERASALKSYASWKDADNGQFVKDELARIEAERLDELARIEAERLKILEQEFTRRQETIERHRTRVESSGRTYLGTVARTTPTLRVAHCWSCHAHLDNSVDVECAACHWILCRCGACGCGRNA